MSMHPSVFRVAPFQNTNTFFFTKKSHVVQWEFSGSNGTLFLDVQAWCYNLSFAVQSCDRTVLQSFQVAHIRERPLRLFAYAVLSNTSATISGVLTQIVRGTSNPLHNKRDLFRRRHLSVRSDARHSETRQCWWDGKNWRDHRVRWDRSTASNS